MSTEQELMNKAEELRRGIRNNNQLGNDQLIGGADGSGFQVIQGSGGTDSGKQRADGGNTNGPGKGTRGPGRGNRRLSSDNSSIYDGTHDPTPKSRGRPRLKRLDDVPGRTFDPLPEIASEVKSLPKRGPNISVGRKLKETKDALFGGSKPLTKHEAEELREPLVAAILDYSEYLDQFIWHQSKDSEQHPIWSNMDSEEANTIARTLLKRGQKSAGTAQVVRTMVDSSDYIATIMIVGPRVIQTSNQLTKRQREERMKRLAAGNRR